MSRAADAPSLKGLGIAAALAALVEAMPQVAAGLKRPGIPAELRALFVPGSLGPRHIPALSYLLTGGPMSVTDLAARLDVSLPAASALVADLSRIGLAERHEDDADRRRTIVSLAPAHRDTVERWLASRTDPMRRALQRLSPAERAAMVKGLRLLLAELGEDGTSSDRAGSS